MCSVIKKISLFLVTFTIGIIILLAVIYNILNVTNGEITSSSQLRKYLLYVPDTYNPDSSTPLIISLHGFAEWPAHQMQVSGWNDLADRFGFLVVYPEGTRFPLRWHISGIPEMRGDSIMDIAFIADLIDRLSSEYNIDNSRIYANGLSNGGGMTHLLACELSDRIAAIGVVAGAYTYPWEECNPSRPVPMIGFHGTEDRFVPFEGGKRSPHGGSLPSIQHWVGIFAERNGCDLNPTPLFSEGEVKAIRFTGCLKNAEVRFYTIQGGGHSWPGGGYLPKFIVGHTTQDINATELMWEFFQRYSLLK